MDIQPADATRGRLAAEQPPERTRLRGEAALGKRDAEAVHAAGELELGGIEREIAAVDERLVAPGDRAYPGSEATGVGAA